MTREEITAEALKRGWSADRFDHLQKEADGRKYRLKFQGSSVRFEVQVVHDAHGSIARSTEWMRLDSAYYAKIVAKNGRVAIGRRLI